MSSLQNMLNAYFHMKNHYRKLKNVQSRVNTNKPRRSLSAGQSKKLCTKSKGFDMSETKGRPPTRRNDIAVTDKSTTSKIKSAKDKFRTTIFDHDSPRASIDVGEHDYLQFSLRITEEIIRCDMYTNEEMIRVLKHHYKQNRFRLNQDKLLATVAELCGELNIPLNDKLLQFLNDDTNFTVNRQQNEHNLQETSKISSKQNLNQKEFKAILQNEVNIHSQNQASQNSSMLLPDQLSSIVDETLQEAGQFATVNFELIRELSPNPQKHEHNDHNDTNDVKNMLTDKEVDCKSTPQNRRPSNKGLKMEEGTFEFTEEILKAPGEELPSSVDSENKITDFEVLHDGTNNFEHDSDKGSVISTLPELYSREKPRIEKKFVIAHYSTSVEPEIVETKEFSSQTTSDFTEKNSKDQEKEMELTQPTQMSVTTSSASMSTNQPATHTSQSEIQTSVGFVSPSPSAQPMNYKKCNCYDAESNSSHQYIVLDCPVLIPRNHSRSIEFLNSLVKNGENNDRLSLNNMDNCRLNNVVTNGNCTTPSGRSVNSMNPVNINDYDLTPQKDKNKPLRFKEAAHLNQALVSCCSCMSSNIETTKLMTNLYDKDTSGMSAIDRIERYKEVREKLSYFYPTIATQVSSMELLTGQELQRKASVQNQTPPTYVNDGENENLQFLGNKLSSTNLDDNLRALKTCDKSVSTPLIKTRTPPSPLAKRMRERTRIILDNYLIEVEHAKKKPTQPQLIADKEGEKNVVKTKKSNTSLISNSIDNDHTLEYYNNSESMDRRIQSLLYDIKRYSKDEAKSTRKEMTSQRSDLLDILRQNSTHSGSILPAEVPKPNQLALLHK